MPTYDYICKNCRYEFEQFQTITARPIRKCPRCGKSSLQRLIGAGSGVIFKGSGFYETDYRSESYKKAAESEKKSTEKTTEKKDKSKSKDSKSDSTTKSTSKEKKKSA